MENLPKLCLPRRPWLISRAIGSACLCLNPLKKGMPNTVTLSNGEGIYDLNEEWDAHFDNYWLGTSKDIFKISQEDNKFERIKLLGNLIRKN